ncbi:hypothetical protein GS481_15240 [Rhodococcus hoagii]|nr:hypothetical protein [Prescottella equi]
MDRSSTDSRAGAALEGAAGECQLHDHIGIEAASVQHRAGDQEHLAGAGLDDGCPRRTVGGLVPQPG